MSHLQEALAAEIHMEMAGRRPKLTAVEMQRLTGIKPASWSNYFVSAKRDVPFSVIERTCEALGVDVDEMMRRARLRAERLTSHEAAAERALASMPPDLAEEVRRVDREQRDAQEEDPRVTERPSRVIRSAMTGA